MDTRSKKKRAAAVAKETAARRRRKKTGTNEAASRKKIPKTSNENFMKDEAWKALRPYLIMADKDQMENLAKGLFDELWKSKGRNAAESFRKLLKINKKRNQPIGGRWVIGEDELEDVARGRLAVDDKLDFATFQGFASFEGGGVNFKEIELKSSKDSNDSLLYAGLTDEWDRCEGLRSPVQLLLEYNPESDTINGVILIPTSHPAHDLEPCNGSGFIAFTAERHNDRYKKW